MASQEDSNHGFTPPQEPWKPPKQYPGFAGGSGEGSSISQTKGHRGALAGKNDEQVVARHPLESVPLTQGNTPSPGSSPRLNPTANPYRPGISGATTTARYIPPQLRPGGVRNHHTPVVSSPLNPNWLQAQVHQAQQSMLTELVERLLQAQRLQAQYEQEEFQEIEFPHEQPPQNPLDSLDKYYRALLTVSLHHFERCLKEQQVDNPRRERLDKAYSQFAESEDERLREEQSRQENVQEAKRNFLRSQEAMPPLEQFPQPMSKQTYSRIIAPLGQGATTRLLANGLVDNGEGSSRPRGQRPIGAEVANTFSSPTIQRSPVLGRGFGNFFPTNYKSGSSSIGSPTLPGSTFNNSPISGSTLNNLTKSRSRASPMSLFRNNSQTSTGRGNTLVFSPSPSNMSASPMGRSSPPPPGLSRGGGIHSNSPWSVEYGGATDLTLVPHPLHPGPRLSRPGIPAAVGIITARLPDGSPDHSNSMVMTEAETAVMLDTLSTLRGEILGMPSGSRADISDLFERPTTLPPLMTPSSEASGLEWIFKGNRSIPQGQIHEIENDQYLQHKARGERLEDIMQFSMNTGGTYCPAGYLITMQPHMTELEVIVDRQRRNSTDSTVSVCEEEWEKNNWNIYKLKWRGKGVPPSKRKEGDEEGNQADVAVDGEQQQESQLDGHVSPLPENELEGNGRADAAGQDGENVVDQTNNLSLGPLPPASATPERYITIEETLDELIVQVGLEEKEAAAKEKAQSQLLARQEEIRTLLEQLQSHRDEFAEYMNPHQLEEITRWILTVKIYNDNLTLDDFLTSDINSLDGPDTITNNETEEEADVLIEFDGESAMKLAKVYLNTKSREMKEVRKMKRKKENRMKNQKEWEEQVKFTQQQQAGSREGVKKEPDGVRKTQSRKE